MRSDFRDLVAYRLAAEVADDIEAQVRTWESFQLIIARGSLYEAEHWLARAAARGLIAEAASQRLDELARTLNGLVRQLGSS